MKLRALLALPLVLATIACSPPPEPTASSREEAMGLCGEKLDVWLAEIDKEKKLYQSEYARYQKMWDEDFGTFIDTFSNWIFFSDDNERITIIRGYCQLTPNKKHKGLWHTTGYVEYLRQPLDGYGNSEVDRTYTSNTMYSWRAE